MKRSEPLSLEEVLTLWLPYRLDAVNSAAWALNLQTRFPGNAPLRASIEGQLHIKGNLALFVKPIIESGFIHARAILEFLGLVARGGKLVQVSRRQPSDVAIEHYSISGKQLPMLTLDEAYAAINMPRPVVEWALVGIIENTNKLLAHVTTGEVLTMAMHGQITVAFEAMPALLRSHFYEKMGRHDEFGHPYVFWEETNERNN